MFLALLEWVWLAFFQKDFRIKSEVFKVFRSMRKRESLLLLS